MLDHIGFVVSDIAASGRFFDEALAPLGLVREVDFEHEGKSHIGYGRGKPFFWIGSGGPAGGPCHVALVAADPKAVDAFYLAAISAGGRDNGAPGLRPHYHAGYYAAFVLDPDGNNIEAVHHIVEGGQAL